MARYRYRLHGLDVEVNVPVPGWPVLRQSLLGSERDVSRTPWRIDVHVNSVSVVDEVTPASGLVRWQWRDFPGSSVLDVVGTPPGWDPSIASVARFRVDYGSREINVRHSHEDVRGCLDLLARWVLPDIARSELDLLPLHACAVHTTAGVVLLLGNSGRGKSSLTAALLAVGAGFFGDEPISIDPGRVWPGTLVLRIDPMVARELLDRVGPIDGSGKALLRYDIDSLSPRPLLGLMVLTPRRQEGPLVRLTRMPATDALVALMSLRYSRTRNHDRIRDDLRRVAEVVRAVPVCELSLLDDRARVLQAADQILEAVAGLGATSPSAG